MNRKQVLEQLEALADPMIGHKSEFSVQRIISAKIITADADSETTQFMGFRVPPFLDQAMRSRASRQGKSVSIVARDLVLQYVLEGFAETWAAAVASGAVIDADLPQFELAANGFMGRGWPGDPEADLIEPSGVAWHCTYKDGALVSKQPLKVAHG